MSLMNRRKLHRRSFLRRAAVLGGALLAACAGRPPAGTPSGIAPIDADHDSEPDVAPDAASPTQPQAAESIAQPQAPDSAAQPQPPTVADASAPTPACPDADEPTPQQGAGPFFSPDSPERTSLREAGLAGAPLVLTGYVYSTACRPVAGALLDFWHADGAGQYDNQGFRMRGHQFASAQGQFRLETIRPGHYPGRTPHIHVRVQAPGQPVLTTQLYFPDEPANATDGIYDPRLEMTLTPTASETHGHFNFIVPG